MRGNLLAAIPSEIPEEIIQPILSSDTLKIERIISKGQKSPEDFWYEEEQNEFVIVLKGEGSILFEEGEEVTLFPGDYLNIPAMKKHKVSYTKEDEETVWLAVFY